VPTYWNTSGFSRSQFRKTSVVSGSIKKRAPSCFKWVKTRHRRKIWNSRTQEKERNRMAASNLKSLAPWKWV
jgi:hypothetical protein